VNEVCEQCDRPREREHERLQGSGDGEDPKTDGYGANAGAGSDYRRVNPTVGMPVVVVMVATFVRSDRQPDVTVRAVVVMRMGPGSVPVGKRAVHGGERRPTSSRSVASPRGR
jgi:hypothetical protein